MRRVRDVLRTRVLTGVYGNRPLPSEAALAAELGASRNVVRDVLALLRMEGLVDRIPGVGTLVVSGKAVQGLDRLRGLAESFDTGCDRVVNQVLLADTVPATPTVAERLEVTPGTEVIALERVRMLDDQPLSLDASYLPADIGRPLLEMDLTRHDVFGLIEGELGLCLGAAALSIEAIAADRTVAGLLRVPDGFPLLFLERLTYTDAGRPIDLEFVRFRGDRMSLSAWLHRTPDPHSNHPYSERG
ncbi:hypothetical protein AQJ91_17455 [Streptomyces dysideae]|uniref:HTH gntR-type domain-containing protein n=1 Tax=Streptomyces dysideae TaxID=909626 RepID=A0A101UZV1_9ACTN|nr:hypothetical protein AQJ91_17455 [Streptomyces dysideae]